MNSLGDISLFLGDNSSISIIWSKFSGCQSNCIYFTHDFDTVEYGTNALSDLGVYYVESGKIELHYRIDESLIANMSDQPPIWVVPTIEF